MAVNFKLSDIKPVDPQDDPMGREWVGYRATLTDEQVFTQNRGMWFLAARAEEERYATFSYTGKIVVVVEITGVETLPWARPNGRRDKQAVIGRVLESGHPAYDFFIGRPIAAARNPVSYINDPEPRRAPERRSCACGCDTPVQPPKHFAPGHDQRAVHERIARRWGDTVGFIRWFDETYGRQAA